MSRPRVRDGETPTVESVDHRVGPVAPFSHVPLILPTLGDARSEGYTNSHTIDRRLFKKAVQQGRSER